MQPNTDCSETMPLPESVASPVFAISSRIAAHAARVPRHLAVVDEAMALSFAELDHRSNQLAAHLIEAGAGPDLCVGLFLDRSADFVLAALAVLKAGAAYLPLDPHTPSGRIATILTDADSSLLLTHRRKTRGWSTGPWRTLEIETVNTSRAMETTAPLQFEPDPQSLAYVIYTSGSSGRPKGVEITQANLLNFIQWHQTAFEITAADRASQVVGLGFDPSGWEIWPHLTAGASLYIADETTRRSPQILRDWIVANQITISFAPTVLAEQLMHMNWPAETVLRTLLTGGDVLHRRPVAGLPFVVVNNYGPTECTIVSTSGVVAPHSDSFGLPSIGRPIRNTTALILDSSLRPVPSGEAGELCLAGALVGRGYRNSPELTTKSFVTYSQASGPPLRIYRTGDRARLLPNGEIAFLGRLDDQIKISGYRIEPGEIVSWLDQYPGVEASAVFVSRAAVVPTLIACIVASDARPTAADLRKFLSAHLPDYMIPAQFVRIAELPLTRNGKLDKTALPEPSGENLLPERAPIAAASESNGVVQNDGLPQASGIREVEVSQKIGALVASLLEQPAVAADDNFFMIGGHSMLGVQLVARIRDLFGVKLTLRQLFNAPTVAALSSEVERLIEASHG